MNPRMSGERWREWAGDWASSGWAGSGRSSGWSGGWAGARPSAGMRIGDAEREAAVSALGEHYAAGRLSKEEYDERAGSAWAAKTAGDLAPLFDDLPRAAARPPQPTPERRPDRRPHVPFLPVLLVLVGVVALTHLWPILLIVGVLWWAGVFRWGRRHSWHGRTGCR